MQKFKRFGNWVLFPTISFPLKNAQYHSTRELLQAVDTVYKPVNASKKRPVLMLDGTTISDGVVLFTATKNPLVRKNG